METGNSGDKACLLDSEMKCILENLNRVLSRFAKRLRSEVDRCKPFESWTLLGLRFEILAQCRAIFPSLK